MGICRAQIETPEIMSGLCQVFYEWFYIRGADPSFSQCLHFSNIKVCFRMEVTFWAQVELQPTRSFSRDEAIVRVTTWRTRVLFAQLQRSFGLNLSDCLLSVPFLIPLPKVKSFSCIKQNPRHRATAPGAGWKCSCVLHPR